jgi:hypothetical protein
MNRRASRFRRLSQGRCRTERHAGQTNGQDNQNMPQHARTQSGALGLPRRATLRPQGRPRLPTENPAEGLTISDRYRSRRECVCPGKCQELTTNDEPDTVTVRKKRF